MIFEISKQEERRAKALYESYAKLIADLDTKLTLPPPPALAVWSVKRECERSITWGNMHQSIMSF